MHNYYNAKDYLLEDTVFDKYHRVVKICYVNKYDKSREFVRSYYPNGNIQSKLFFHNNEIYGPFILYYPEVSKGIYAKGIKKNGILNGRVVYFYKNGKVDKIMYFKKGKKVGTWKTFDSIGHLIDSTVYSSAF